MIDYILLEKYTQNITLLFVEDDKTIRNEIYELLSDVFPHITLASDGEEGLNHYINFYENEKKHYDLVITDIKMPKMNGIELTKKVYTLNKNQPVIVLSAHDDSEYLLELINMGIEKFILKPLDINHFIQTIFNTSQSIYTQKEALGKIENNYIVFNETTLWDKENKKLRVNGNDIKLSKKELHILECLLQVSNKICSPDEIITYVWKDELYANPSNQNLNNVMARLRKKIPTLPIENIYGLGYKINIS